MIIGFGGSLHSVPRFVLKTHIRTDRDPSSALLPSDLVGNARHFRSPNPSAAAPFSNDTGDDGGRRKVARNEEGTKSLGGALTNFDLACQLIASCMVDALALDIDHGSTFSVSIL